MMTKYTIDRCRCPNKNCRDWHVLPVAAVQGVHFTRRQATVVAAVLSAMEEEDAEGEES